MEESQKLLQYYQEQTDDYRTKFLKLEHEFTQYKHQTDIKINYNPQHLVVERLEFQIEQMQEYIAQLNDTHKSEIEIERQF